MSFSIIAAIGKNREIGKDNQLIWHLPGDLQFFKKTTMGHPILMGRKTFESLPGLLSGRKHYVVSRSDICFPQGVERIADLDSFVLEHQDDTDEIFVIGGESIYRSMLKNAKKIYLTEINASDRAADAFFPDFDSSLYIKQIIGRGEDNGIKYTFVCYKLK